MDDFRFIIKQELKCNLIRFETFSPQLSSKFPKTFYFDQFKVKTIRVPENGKQSNETFPQHHVVNLI